jgi:uncharacterized Zn-binding protein involved in type VI secretion
MPECARIGDAISHGGSIIQGSDNVFAEGSGVARIGDAVYCAKHKTQTIVSGSGSVFTNGRGTARVGDSISCGATIITGANSVLVGG